MIMTVNCTFSGFRFCDSSGKQLQSFDHMKGRFSISLHTIDTLKHTLDFDSESVDTTHRTEESDTLDDVYVEKIHQLRVKLENGMICAVMNV